MLKKLLNPFIFYSDRTLLIIGILATITGFMLGHFFNGIFDGALDLHFIEKSNAVQLIYFLLISILSMVICLFIAAYVVNSKSRIIDVFVLVLIARIPIYLLTFINFNNYHYLFSQKLIQTLPSIRFDQTLFYNFLSDNFFMLSISTLLTISMLIWYFILLYNGFKNAINLKTILHKAIFVVAILLAEILSKSLIFKIFN